MRILSMPVLLFFTRRFTHGLWKTIHFVRLVRQAWLVLGRTFVVVFFAACLQPNFPMVSLSNTVSKASCRGSFKFASAQLRQQQILQGLSIGRLWLHRPHLHCKVQSRRGFHHSRVLSWPRRPPHRPPFRNRLRLQQRRALNCPRRNRRPPQCLNHRDLR